MPHRKGTLALAMIIASGACAVTASSVHATNPGFITSVESSTTLQGIQLPDEEAKVNAFTFPSAGHNVKCNAAEFHFLQTLSTFGLLEFLTVPTYSECKTEAGAAVTITFNSCRYRTYDLTTSGTDYQARTELVCLKPAEQIEVHVYLFPNYTTPICKIEIFQQTNIQGLTITNEKTGGASTNSVLLGGAIKGLTYTVTGGGSQKCANHGTFSDLDYDMNVTITGKNHIGQHRGIHVG